MFCCCSLETSHPLLLPQSSKVCSLHLCLFFCFAYKGYHYHLSKSHIYVLVCYKIPLQHHSSKASVLQRSAFFIVQLSHPYITSGKTIALTRWNFVSKIMSLLFNMLSRLVIAFLPRSKHLLISWLQSPSAEILEPKKIKSVMVSIVSPSMCQEVMGLDAVIFIF